MVKYWGALALSACLYAVGAPSAAFATTYYFNSVKGDDRFSGTSDAQSWKSLSRIKDIALQPGDQLLLAAGSAWKEPLTISKSGKANAPITVAATGIGPRPRIDVGGISPHGVAVVNAEYVTISGLEVTNDASPPAQRYGVLISAQDRGVTRGIRVTDMYVHDVRGTNARKDNGGIVFSATGQKLATRFRDLIIERNIVWRVDRSGIAGISDRVTFSNWFPSEEVVIRDNYVEDVGGDGIVPRGTDGTLIEVIRENALDRAFEPCPRLQRRHLAVEHGQQPDPVERGRLYPHPL